MVKERQAREHAAVAFARAQEAPKSTKVPENGGH